MCRVYDFDVHMPSSHGSHHDQNQDLIERIRILERKPFRYKNLLETEIKSYTGIDKADFEVVATMIVKFFPLKYWSGKPVTSLNKSPRLNFDLLHEAYTSLAIF